MRILVIGGCGFIGSHIVNELKRNDHVVAVFDIKSNIKTSNSKYHFIGDIKKLNQIKQCFSLFKPDVVIHTAAQVMLRKSIEDPIFDAETNIVGTINILEACKESKIKKIIYTSTGGACYGEPKKLPVAESATTNPLSPYGCSKLSAEHYIYAYSSYYGFECLIFRFGNVYGPGDDPKTKRLIPVIIDSILNNKDFSIFGDGNQTRDFIYVKDVSNIIARCVTEKTKSVVYNLASGRGISVNQVYALVTKELKIQKKAVYVEKIIGEVKSIFLDIQKAKTELGYKPTSFEKGIKKTIKWVLKTNNCV